MANRLAFGGGRKQAWLKYLAARTFQSAAFVGQDTYAGERALRRMHVSVIRDPNLYEYFDDWRTRELPELDQEHNNWVIGQVKRMIGPSANPYDKKILLEVLGKAGHWDETYELMMEIIRETGDEMDRSGRDARLRLQYTSLAGRFDEADAFWDGLSPEVKGQSTRFQALMHFRRSGNEDREFAEMIDRLEQKKWVTINGLPRLYHLVEKRLTPEERIRVVSLLPKKLKSSRSEVVLLRSHQELGNEADVRKIASLLLADGRAGKGDLASEEEFKEDLRSIVGETAPWPTARSIQGIPENRKMYLQPVGEYPEEVLNRAVRIAGEFFGCDFVVRPAIPPPTARTVFYDDMVRYIGVPLLRRFATARPPPDDAIYQAYLVDQYFLIYGKGPTGFSLYRGGLGYLVSYRHYQKHIDNDSDRAEALASELIRGFRYFVERSQGISYEESPDSSSCVNSGSSVRRAGETKRGYCPECARNYASADMDEVFTFHQALPSEDAFSEEYLGWRHPIDEHERESIRAYAESLRSER